MKRSLLEQFQAGMINDGHLIIGTLCEIDPSNPGALLSGYPDDILQTILRDATDFLHHGLVTNYERVPTQEQLLAARQWIETALRQEAAR